MNRLEEMDQERLKKKQEMFQRLSFWMFAAGLIYIIIVLILSAGIRPKWLDDSYTGPIIVGVFVLFALWFVFMWISRDYLGRYRAGIASLVKVEEVFGGYGAQVSFEQGGMLTRGDLLRMRAIRKIGISVNIHGSDFVKGQYKDKALMAANMRLTVDNGADDTEDYLYSGRITLLERTARFPGILLLLRPKKTKSPGLSERFRNELKYMVGFSFGIGGKKPISVEPQLEEQWEAYTDREKEAEILLHAGTPFHRAMIEQQDMDFVLYADDQILIGSKRRLVLDGNTVDDAMQNCRESIRKIMEEIDAILR